MCGARDANWCRDTEKRARQMGRSHWHPAARRPILRPAHLKGHGAAANQRLGLTHGFTALDPDTTDHRVFAGRVCPLRKGPRLWSCRGAASNAAAMPLLGKRMRPGRRFSSRPATQLRSQIAVHPEPSATDGPVRGRECRVWRSHASRAPARRVGSSPACARETACRSRAAMVQYT